MSEQIKLQQFKSKLTDSLFSSSFLKISLSSYRGAEQDLKNIYVRRINIKRSEMLSFTYRFKTKDVFKNLQAEEGIALIMQYISSDFRICTLLTSSFEAVLEYDRKGSLVYREKAVDTGLKPSLDHDKPKKRMISPLDSIYLQRLRIADGQGSVFKNAQDKYRQINQYIEIISSLIKDLPAGRIQKVVDMGAGKGYLTFALYDYLHHVLKLDASVTGVEFRPDLVELCNGIAKESGFDQLRFIQGSIDSYETGSLNLLIALHACDTATDDAIYKGITAQAELIIVAPCCHKQIRRAMEKAKVRNDVSFLTKHGIFLERQAEMVTDGIRALILEYFGYKTKVFEFVSGVHTPKNVLVVGTKGRIDNKRQLEILHQLNEIKAFFGIDYHHLEKLMQLDKQRFL